MAIIILLAACGRHGQITPVGCLTCGYVKEYHTGIPLAHAKVGIYEDFNYGKVVEEIFTDSIGWFKAKTDWAGTHKFMMVSAPGYYSYTYGISATNYTAKDHIFYLDRPGTIQVHLKNVHPFDQYDRVGVPDFFIILPLDEFYGKEVDTMLCCLTAPAYKETQVRAFVRKNMKDTTNHVSCIPLPDQTILVDLNY